MLKKMASTLVVAGLLLAPAQALAQDPTSSLPYISLQEQVLDLPPSQSAAGTLLLPVRALGDGLGFSVHWSPETNSVTISQGENFYTLYIDRDFYVKNSKSLKLGEPASMVNGNLYAPLAFFNEIMDLSATVDTNGNVAILNDIPTLMPGVTVNLTQGDYFKITLEANDSTGYSWHYNSEKPLVKLIATTTTARNTAIGSPSTVHYIFKAEAVGQQSLDFQYLRPWENKAPEQEAKFPLMITAPTPVPVTDSSAV